MDILKMFDLYMKEEQKDVTNPGAFLKGETDSMLSRHVCDRSDAWMECDQTTFQVIVCDTCVDVKMRPYRKFMLENINPAKAGKELRNEY